MLKKESGTIIASNRFSKLILKFSCSNLYSFKRKIGETDLCRELLYEILWACPHIVDEESVLFFP